MVFTPEELAFLESQTLGRLATKRPDGTLQNSPVGFVVDAGAGTVDIAGRAMGASRKFHNVADNGVVALVVDSLESRDPWVVRGIEIRGEAEALTDQPKINDYASPELIRIHPRRIVSWGLTDELGMRGRDVDDGLPPDIA